MAGGNTLRVGDWITSYSAGIFRVEHVIIEYYDESYPLIPPGKKIGDVIEHRTIIAKKLFNSKFKKLLGYESCSELLAKKVTQEQKGQMKIILAQNPQFLQQLDEYTIPPLRTIFNMPLQIDSVQDMENVKCLMSFIDTGKSFLEITQEMQKLNIIKPKYYGNYKFQFVNTNFEYKDKRKIWRETNLYTS